MGCGFSFVLRYIFEQKRKIQAVREMTVKEKPDGKEPVKKEMTRKDFEKMMQEANIYKRVNGRIRQK